MEDKTYIEIPVLKIPESWRPILYLEYEKFSRQLSQKC